MKILLPQTHFQIEKYEEKKIKGKIKAAINDALRNSQPYLPCNGVLKCTASCGKCEDTITTNIVNC